MSRCRTLSEAVEVEDLRPGDVLAEGFFRRLNALALAHAPRVLVIHNDGFADGVPLPLALANPCLVDLAPCFRIRGARVRPPAFAAALARAREVCAAGHGPFLIELLETE